jgi:hypothetical protein
MIVTPGCFSDLVLWQMITFRWPGLVDVIVVPVVDVPVRIASR